MGNQETRQLNLHTGPLRFNLACWDSKLRGLMFCWVAETEVQNVSFYRMLCIGLIWPPIRVLESFMTDEDMED